MPAINNPGVPASARADLAARAGRRRHALHDACAPHCFQAGSAAGNPWTSATKNTRPPPPGPLLVWENAGWTQEMADRLPGQRRSCGQNNLAGLEAGGMARGGHQPQVQPPPWTCCTVQHPGVELVHPMRGVYEPLAGQPVKRLLFHLPHRQRGC